MLHLINNLSHFPLNSFTVRLFTTSSGRLFRGVTTLLVKKSLADVKATYFFFLNFEPMSSGLVICKSKQLFFFYQLIIGHYSVHEVRSPRSLLRSMLKKIFFFKNQGGKYKRRPPERLKITRNRAKSKQVE